MQHLLEPAGLAALAETMRHLPLVALDFDGTLAPIAPRPEHVSVPPGIGWRLARLAQCVPVAIVTGRRIADLRPRIGAAAAHVEVIGNHGAENTDDPAGSAVHARTLDPLRATLADAAQALDAAGITVEDKDQSIALHYRLARERAAAADLALRLCASAAPSVRAFGGKAVVNAVSAHAPDKSDAVYALACRYGATHVIFAGDDVNDEPVFAGAPPHWLTIRIGRDAPSSRARFYLGAQGEMADLLARMLALLTASGA